MPAGKLIALYGICIAVFFALDFTWLSTTTSRIYQPMLGDLLAKQSKLGVAAAFYLLYVVGILFAWALLAGCAQLVPQTIALRSAWPADVPQMAELRTVPFFPQSEYQCGPAAGSAAAESEADFGPVHSRSLLKRPPLWR